MDAFHHAEFNELSLDPSWFTGTAEGRFAYVALGHYHGHTELASRAHYAGSPDRVSIKESGEVKGFLEVTLGGKIRLVPTATRPYVDLPLIRAEDLDAGEVLAACEAALANTPEGAVVRLRLVDLSQALRGAIDWKAVRQAGAHLLDLNLDARFADDGHHAATADHLSLHEEFEAYAATYPMEGLDRKAVLNAARDLLGGQ